MLFFIYKYMYSRTSVNTLHGLGQVLGRASERAVNTMYMATICGLLWGSRRKTWTLRSSESDLKTSEVV